MLPDEFNRLARLAPNLKRRAFVLDCIRAFFKERDFLEVDTPIRAPAIAPEANITPFESEGWFLAASPELHMKRLLAAGYTKLFSRILDSTIWREDDKTRILWITMLAMANQHGVVECTIPGLADRARISIKECESALQRFQQPDKYSWSKEKQGRRIEAVDGGWFLINHDKYRQLLSREDQREKTRLRVARYRYRNASVTLGNAGNDKQKQIQIHNKTKVKSVVHFVHPSLEEVAAYCKERANGIDPQKWFDYYSSNGWRVGRNPMKDWKAAVRTWEKTEYAKGGGNGNKPETFGQIAVSNSRRAAAAVLARSGVFAEPSPSLDFQSGTDGTGLRDLAKNTRALPPGSN